jgi:hypothetical protein
MLIKTFELLPGICVTVQTETGGSYMDKEYLYTKLQPSQLAERDGVRMVTFIQAVAQTKSLTGDLGFVWPNAAADIAELMVAFEWYITLPRDPFVVWLNAIDEVNRPPVDPDLVPENLLPDEKKEMSAS